MEQQIDFAVRHGIQMVPGTEYLVDCEFLSYELTQFVVDAAATPTAMGATANSGLLPSIPALSAHEITRLTNSKCRALHIEPEASKRISKRRRPSSSTHR
jgi:hypothetical protein